MVRVKLGLGLGLQFDPNNLLTLIKATTLILSLYPNRPN